MNPRLHAMSLPDAAAAIADGRITARALADAELVRIDATDHGIEAWAALDAAHVRACADACDRNHRHAPLAGLGIGVKDIFATRALPTRMGSPAFAGWEPTDDAACVARLEAAGGYVFGKTVTTELAFMHPGKTHNPWNSAHTPGGSSSGSAASVAAGHVTGAIGTQTNGSIIRPAAYCGVVGFKPTLGTLPIEGVYLFSETFDTAGTFSRDVAGAGRLASALASPGLLPGTPPPRAAPPRLGWLPAFPWTTVAGALGGALEKTATMLEHAGAIVTRVALPAEVHRALELHRTIMLVEGARNLSELQSRARAQLSATLNAGLDEGRATSAGAYREAQDERLRAIEILTRWLSPFDAIVTPAVPSAAPRGLTATGDPSCCTLWSLVGFPALALPFGLDATGLPLALQLAAPSGADAGLLSVARWCEERLPFVGLA